MDSFEIRKLNENDRPWTEHFLAEFWHSTKLVTRGKIHLADELPGFIAQQGDKRVGLVTYHLQNNDCEIVTLKARRYVKCAALRKRSQKVQIRWSRLRDP